MNEGNPQAGQKQLRGISWWASALVGLLLGVTLTWIRTQRYFFFAGAAILAVLIIMIGIRTIRRRAAYPQLKTVQTGWAYGIWSLVLLVLAGPVQLVLVADEFSELVVKSLVVSVGLALGLHEVDRALARDANRQVPDAK